MAFGLMIRYRERHMFLFALFLRNSESVEISGPENCTTMKCYISHAALGSNYIIMHTRAFHNSGAIECFDDHYTDQDQNGCGIIADL